MPPTIVSPQGFARCPQCNSHVKLETTKAPTCPFCGGRFGVGESGAGGTRGTAVLAAALLGSQLACGTLPPPTPLYGVPADVADTGTTDVEDAPDAESDAAVDTGTDLDIVTADADVSPAPPYGIPSDPDAP